MQSVVTTRSHPIRTAWLSALLLFIFGAIVVQYAVKVHQADHARSAFLRWRPQILELDDGVDIWEKYAYPNPPMMALVLKPFVQFSAAVGSWLWFLLKATLAAISIIMMWWLLDTSERPFAFWGKGLTAILVARPVEGDLIHGNVNLLILFLIVMALIAFCHQRDTLAGLLLGLGIACKLTPVLFLLYFLYKRAWGTLFASMAGTLIFGLCVPALFLGWAENLQYLRSWHHQMIAPYAAGVVTSEHKNQSLPGLLHRMLSEQPSFSDYVGEEKVVLETHNLMSLSPHAVQGIVVACMIACAFAAMLCCRSSIAEQSRLHLAAEFGVVVLGMLLFCERTWKHHCVTLLLPFAVLAYCVSSPACSRGLRWFSGIALGAAALLMLSTSTGVMDHDRGSTERIGKLFQVYGAYVWAFLILLLGMFVILSKTKACPKSLSPR